MESAIVQTGLGLWWSKVGKWQALATLVTLATFFITLYITGNKVIATYAAFVVAYAFVATAVAYAFVATAVVTFAAAVAFATAAFATAALATAALAFVVVAFAFVVVAFAAGKEVKRGSKKATWFSYVAHFIITFALMLITILLY